MSEGPLILAQIVDLLPSGIGLVLLLAFAAIVMLASIGVVFFVTRRR